MAVDLKTGYKLHKAGDLTGAEAVYRDLVKSKTFSPYLFQNLGAILRQKEKPQEAIDIYNHGLEIYPNDPGILANRANILRADKPVTALYDLLAAIKADPQNINAWITAVSILRDIDSPGSAYNLAREAVPKCGANPKVLVMILASLGDLELLNDEPLASTIAEILSLIESRISALKPAEQAETYFSLAYLMTQATHSREGLRFYQKGLQTLTGSEPQGQADRQDRDKLFIQNAWNIACALLKNQQLEEGWKLYDYGLGVPAKGQQEWQRALKKPFSGDQLPLWRGEPLSGKRLLLLEEQGIGDTMMFLTLLPALNQEAEQVDIILADRLYPIYQRSLVEVYPNIRLWHQRDAVLEKISSSSYDYQCPLGSICRYRFTKPEDYAQKSPILIANEAKTKALRSSYQERYPGAKLIGVSWSGGGSPERIRKKSPPRDLFDALLTQPLDNIVFVSLQYGDVRKVCESWQSRGAALIHDESIDPLIDMEAWLNQVAACDAVISAANTTIHGAGGLGIPTMCLLSKDSDWRWFDDPSVQRSYWYPSVGILRESLQEGWSPALRQTRQWLREGCGMPTGPAYTSPSQVDKI